MTNGNPNASDLRGFGLAMATNLPGPAGLNPRVDPVLNGDADYATNIGSVKGEVKHKLYAAESGLPAHNHPITDPTHTHADGTYDRLLTHSGTNTAPGVDNNDTTGSEPSINTSKPMKYAATGITVNNNVAADAALAHETRQPTVYVNCIQRVF
jgi:hypothetical protein